MEYFDLHGEKIPKLGLGTWGMGGRQIEDHTWDTEEVNAIRMAVELGITHIDTAEYYGAGHSEELVGEAIEVFPRKDLFITTKVWRTHLGYHDLIDAMEKSLKRLNLDYVDLYLVHWPNSEIPLEETMNAMEYVAKEGYTRYIGVSNFSKQLVEKAQNFLRDTYLVANQVHYSLMDQKPKMELLPFLHRKGTMLIAYRPLERGLLVNPGNMVLDEIADKYNKSRAQVALNWLIKQKNVLTIPKSKNPVHLLDNIGALGWRLSDEDALLLADSFT